MADEDGTKPDQTPAFTYSIDGREVRIVARGTPTAGAFDELLRRIAADPNFRRGMPVLHDRRGATTPSKDYAYQVAAILREHAERLGPCRWAVVVSNHDHGVAYGMSRMISALHDSSLVTSRPFTDENEAREWLGTAAPEGRDAKDGNG